MEKRLQPLRAKVRLRRAIVREAEKRCYEMGRNFRGRIRPIYARDIARQMDVDQGERMDRLVKAGGYDVEVGDGAATALL